MDEKELKKSVSEKYNMELEAFLTQKVETESLFNYEIAELLGISSSEVCSLIKSSGKQRGCVFKRQFKKKYGSNALKQFDKMISDPETTLADVGRHFGFSREYARQAYKTLYGKPYTKAHQKKKSIRREISKSKRRNPVPEVPSTIISKLASLGFKPEFSGESSSYIITVNGYRILLRSSSNPVKKGKQFFFQISLNRSQNNRDFDFIICLLRDQSGSAFYVIPEAEPVGSSISLPGPKKAKGKKYGKYLDAWHLIEPCNPVHQNSLNRKRQRFRIMSNSVDGNRLSSLTGVIPDDHAIKNKSERSYI